eukprot:COSAG06_NODE_13652_length_1235_cov_1.310739_2_plen_45_part_00
MLLQTMSGMIVINTTLMSLLKVSDEEQDLLGDEEAIEMMLGKGR